MRFRRTIGPFGLLFAGIGSIIGSGWLFGPLYAAQIAGPAAVLSWIIGGLLMLIIAFTFAELGSAFPIAGGMVQYAQLSHGPLVSFMTGWMIWVSSIAVAPVETMGTIQYMSNYVPGLVTKVENQTVLTHIGIFFGAVIMLVLCLLNYQCAKFFSQSNSTITALKLIVPITTCVLFLGLHFHSENFYMAESGGFAPYGLHDLAAVSPSSAIYFRFGYFDR